MSLNFGFSENTLSAIIEEARKGLPSPDMEQNYLERLRETLEKWRFENEKSPPKPQGRPSVAMLFDSLHRLSNINLAIKLWCDEYKPFMELISNMGYLPLFSVLLIDACGREIGHDADDIFRAYGIFMGFKNIREAHDIALELLESSRIIDDYSRLLNEEAKVKLNRETARLKGAESNRLKAEDNKRFVLKINQELFRCQDFAAKFRKTEDRAKYIKGQMDINKKTKVNGEPYSVATIQDWIKGIEPASS